VTGSSIVSRKSNDPVPVETRLQLVLALLAHEMTVAEAARRHGGSTGSINPWRNRFIDAGKAAMEDGMPGKAGVRGSLVERRQRAEIQELKFALAEAPASRNALTTGG
jgi:transposase